MNDILKQILYAALTICVPIATVCIRGAANAFGNSLAEKAKNQTIERVIREITEAVADAVAAMNQSYVDDLKKAGTFDEDKQAEALSRAISAALKSMSQDAIEYIKEISGGDTVGYLTNRIQPRLPRTRPQRPSSNAQHLKPT